ncbi:MAG: hypothetical protein RBT65_09830 [Methanolobus sp.]|nr:hypothetical protein [Methanolobus sp.]
MDYIVIPEELVDTVNGKHGNGLYLWCIEIDGLYLLPECVLKDLQFAAVHNMLSSLERIEYEETENVY